MKEIQLTKGYTTIVDDDIYDYLCQWPWHAMAANGKWYAARIRRKAEFPGCRTILIHQVICEYFHIDIPNMVDHVDGDSLNNIKSNLRAADKFQNNQNIPKRTKNQTSSKYKGVTYHKQNK